MRVLMLLLVVAMQEVAVPNKPVEAPVTSYRITGFSFDREPEWRFTIYYQDSNGVRQADEHVGPSSLLNPTGGEPIVNPTGAESFIKQLNTGNFGTISLTKRLLQHLVAHEKIPASTVTGTPEIDK